MAIHNINALNSLADLSYISEYSKDYVLQSLTNLGQRQQIKGDGLCERSFYFKNVFNVSIADNDVQSYVGAMSFNKILNKYEFNIYSTKDLSKSEISDDSIDSKTDNIISFNDSDDINNINIDSFINGITKINDGQIFYHNNDFFTTFIYPVKINNHEVDVLVYDQITPDVVNTDNSKIYNLLNASLRIFIYNNSVYYCFIKRDSDHENIKGIKVNNPYTLACIRYENANENVLQVNKQTIISAINSFQENKNTNITPSAILSLLIGNNNTFINVLNGVRNEISYYNFDEFKLPEEFNGTYMSGIDAKTLSNILEYVNYDFTVIFDKIKTFYSITKFSKTNNKLYKEILISLYDYITNGTCKEILIPLDLSFNYMCNTNDESIIYFSSQDIPVHYIKDSFKKEMSNELNDRYLSNSILAEVNGYNPTPKVNLLTFSIDYDHDGNALNIQVNKKYTLPFISNNYWYINNIKTAFKANGENAGNPNIIIIHNYSEGEYGSSIKGTILSGALINENNISFMASHEPFKFRQPIFYLDDNYTNSRKYDVFEISYSIINPNDAKNFENTIHLLEYSIILLISDVTCIADEDQRARFMEKFGPHGYVTTLWVCNKDEHTGKYKYDLIMDPSFHDNQGNSDNLPLNISSLANTEPLIKWYIENNRKHIIPHKYKHSFLVFDNANDNLKNTNEQKYIYPNIENISAGKYIGSTGNYHNNLNLEIKFNDDVTDALNDEITTISNSSFKYLDRVNSNIVTNSIYSYILNNDKYNFNEYTFNYNVPTLDLKEVILRNATTLNRSNILSLDKNGNIYNAFLGVSQNSEDAETLTLGTGKININLGNDTLIDKANIYDFNEHKRLEIDFKEVYVTNKIESPIINSYNLISNYNTNITYCVSNDSSGIPYEVYNVEYTPISTFHTLNIGQIQHKFTKVQNINIIKYEHRHEILDSIITELYNDFINKYKTTGINYFKIEYGKLLNRIFKCDENSNVLVIDKKPEYTTYIEYINNFYEKHLANTKLNYSEFCYKIYNILSTYKNIDHLTESFNDYMNYLYEKYVNITKRPYTDKLWINNVLWFNDGKKDKYVYNGDLLKIYEILNNIGINYQDILSLSINNCITSKTNTLIYDNIIEYRSVSNDSIFDSTKKYYYVINFDENNNDNNYVNINTSSLNNFNGNIGAAKAKLGGEVSKYTWFNAVGSYKVPLLMETSNSNLVKPALNITTKTNLDQQDRFDINLPYTGVSLNIEYIKYNGKIIKVEINEKNTGIIKTAYTLA